MRSLLEKTCVSLKEGSRITGKGKGKEIITRFDGEVIEGEHEPECKDPRKAPSFRRRPVRESFHEAKYEVRSHINTVSFWLISFSTIKTLLDHHPLQLYLQWTSLASYSDAVYQTIIC